MRGIVYGSCLSMQGCLVVQTGIYSTSTTSSDFGSTNPWIQCIAIFRIRHGVYGEIDFPCPCFAMNLPHLAWYV